MKTIGLIATLAVAAVLVATAVAQPDDPEGNAYHPQGVFQALQATAARDPATRVSAATKLAPLKLPNVAALSKAMWKADRKTLTRQLQASDSVIRFWHGRGQWIRAPRVAKCWDVPWQRSCTVARASLRLHSALANIAETRLTRELPLTNDWKTAVRLVQRIYPGTESWMLSISDREGGWGPWVWYSGMCSSPPCLWTGHHLGADPFGDDAVGGPMQFRYSTFAPYWRAAVKDVKARGFLIPDLGWARPTVEYGASTGYGPWLSPLGQAITAGYMRYTGKDSCHWCLG